MCEISIAGMKFNESQVEALRTHFKEEWQRQEIRDAISVIREVLSSHDGGEPDDEIDQKIVSLLREENAENDIVERFHHMVPEWNEEALQEANEYDVGVWRSLYDIIVPEMRSKLRKEATAKVRTYTVNGKSYTEEEVIAVSDMWKGIQDYKYVRNSVSAALARIADTDAAEWALRNNSDIMEQCMAALPAWREQQHRNLVLDGMALHTLVYGKLKAMYAEHSKRQIEKRINRPRVPV